MNAGVTLPPEDGEDAGKIQTLGARFAHGLISLEEAAELGEVLFLDGDCLGEGDVGAGDLAAGEFDGAGKVLSGSFLRVAGDVAAAHLEGDEEGVEGATVPGFVEGEGAVDEGFGEREVGEHVGIIFGE